MRPGCQITHKERVILHKNLQRYINFYKQQRASGQLFSHLIGTFLDSRCKRMIFSSYFPFNSHNKPLFPADILTFRLQDVAKVSTEGGPGFKSSLYVLTCKFSLCLLGFILGAPAFLRHTKDIQIRLDGESKVARRCENGHERLFLCVRMCQLCDELATCPECAEIGSRPTTLDSR